MIKRADSPNIRAQFLFPVPSHRIATFEARGFERVSCPPAKTYDHDTVEKSCKSILALSGDEKDQLKSLFDISAEEVCAVSREYAKEIKR